MIRKRSQLKPLPGSKAALRRSRRLQRRAPTPLASRGFNRYPESLSDGLTLSVDSVVTDATHQKLVTSFEKRVNWAKTYSRDLRIAKVKSEGDIVQAIRYAKDNGVAIRAMGSMYSWPTIAVPTNEVGNRKQPVTLDMQNYNEILRVDPRAREVEVQAGVKIKDLNIELRRLGLALETLGNVDGQTISGVVSTGTHGKNPILGTISSLIHSMRLVTSSGEVIEISKGDPLYNAAGVSVGMLGVISTLTLRVTSSHDMEYFIEDFGFDVGLSLLDTVLGKYEAISYIYFPTIDRFRVELGKRIELQDAEQVKYHHPPSFNSVQIFGLNILLATLSWIVVTCGWFLGPVLKLIAYLSFTHGRPQSPYYAPSHEIVANNSSLDIKHYEMEFAFDRKDTKAVLKEIRASLKRIGTSPSDVVDVRFTGADPFWLSPAYGRDTVWIDFIVTKQGLSRYQKLYKSVLKVAKRYNGRPHWGKVNMMGAKYTSQCFPKSVEFEMIRQRMDPENTFFNTYLDRFNEATCQQQTGLLIQRRELRAKAREARRQGHKVCNTHQDNSNTVVVIHNDDTDHFATFNEQSEHCSKKRHGEASHHSDTQNQRITHDVEQETPENEENCSACECEECDDQVVQVQVTKAPHHHKYRPESILVETSPMSVSSKIVGKTSKFIPRDLRPKRIKEMSKSHGSRSPTKVGVSPRSAYKATQHDQAHSDSRKYQRNVVVNRVQTAHDEPTKYVASRQLNFDSNGKDISPTSCSTCSPSSGDQTTYDHVEGIDLSQCLRCDCHKHEQPDAEAPSKQTMVQVKQKPESTTTHATTEEHILPTVTVEREILPKQSKLELEAYPVVDDQRYQGSESTHMARESSQPRHSPNKYRLQELPITPSNPHRETEPQHSEFKETRKISEQRRRDVVQSAQMHPARKIGQCEERQAQIHRPQRNPEQRYRRAQTTKSQGAKERQQVPSAVTRKPQVQDGRKAVYKAKVSGAQNRSVGRGNESGTGNLRQRGDNHDHIARKVPAGERKKREPIYSLRGTNLRIETSPRVVQGKKAVQDECESCISCSTCGSLQDCVEGCPGGLACQQEKLQLPIHSGRSSVYSSSTRSYSSDSEWDSPTYRQHQRRHFDDDEEKRAHSDDELPTTRISERRFFTLEAYEDYRNKVDSERLLATKQERQHQKQNMKLDRNRSESRDTLPVARQAESVVGLS